MGRFDVSLLDNDGLFQGLLTEIAEALPPEVAPDGVVVVADLDVGSFSDMPLMTHFSSVAHDGNGPGLHSVTLTVSIFGEVATVYPIVQAVYAGIWAWDDPTVGVIPGLGAVESVNEELSAFSRVGGEAQMENKVAVQYTGSWQLTARNH